MADGEPTNLTSLQMRLRNHCRETGRDLSRAQRHLAAMVVAQMLLDSGTVIKGGRNLEIRYGLNASRASSDLDAVRVSSVENVIDQLEDRLDHGWEGFTGTVKDRGTIPAPVPHDYQPHRLEVSLAYKGRAGVGKVTLELAVEEAGGLGKADTVVSTDADELFTAVGLPPPDSVLVLTLPVQIAQKLHACTTPDDPERGWVNDRAHDLVDLQLLTADLSGSELVEVREAVTRLFRSRKRHTWPPEVTIRDGWEMRYAEEREGVEANLADDVHDAVAWTNDFIARITDA